MRSTDKPVIYLATDHAGLKLKNAIKVFLLEMGYHVHDVGAYEKDADDDYPDFIIPAAEAVAKTRGSMGIVFGGSGVGEALAANKVNGIRAVMAYDAFTAKKSREHNDANVLSLGERTVTKNLRLAKRLVKLWLETSFSGDKRHVRRLKKIAAYEKRRKS